jgi:predicted short-subunit dehydrogenase-like oxidoreductase (DUF2520 family)
MIGSGNAATVLSRCIVEKDHEIVQVFNRTEINGKALADSIGSVFTNDPQQITNEADLYILALSDNALFELPSWLPHFKQLVVHTAGSVSKELLQPVSMNYGVLYPLQSLNAAIKAAPSIPFLVDANSPENLAFLYDFAKSISADVEVASDEDRRAMHLAAVMVNNFTNHLYTVAEKFCEESQINFRLLLPLITETVSRLEYLPAGILQTGPAVRNDNITIERHLQMLANNPHLLKLYETLTESIRLFHKEHSFKK